MSQASIKSRRLKQSSDKISTITEEQATDINFRIILTEQFFQSIYHTFLVKEKLSIKAFSETESPNSSANKLSLDTTESFSDFNNSSKFF